MKWWIEHPFIMYSNFVDTNYVWLAFLVMVISTIIAAKLYTHGKYDDNWNYLYPI